MAKTLTIVNDETVSDAAGGLTAIGYVLGKSGFDAANGRLLVVTSPKPEDPAHVIALDPDESNLADLLTTAFPDQITDKSIDFRGAIDTVTGVEPEGEV